MPSTHKPTRFRRQWGPYTKSDAAVNPDFCPRRQLLGRKLCPTQKVTSGSASPHADSEVAAQRTSPSHTELDISRLLIQGKHTGFASNLLYFSERKCHRESKFSRVSEGSHVLAGTLSGAPDCAGGEQGRGRPRSQTFGCRPA